MAKGWIIAFMATATMGAIVIVFHLWKPSERATDSRRPGSGSDSTGTDLAITTSGVDGREPNASALAKPDDKPLEMTPQKRLAIARQRLPWIPEEKLRALVNDGVLVENIERGHTALGSDLSQLVVAMRLYRQAFGAYPVGTNAEIAKALLAPNAKGGVPFIERKKELVNDAGEFIDPWGTPYRIHVSQEGQLDIRSAGADRIFGSGDDTVPSQ